jgi:hypothetical protein
LQPDPEADLVPYATRDVVGLDIPCLVYFASSLLWRASVAVWRMAGDLLAADLGSKYNEMFRQYLCRETPFPADAAVWISVMKAGNPPFICIGPHLHAKTAYHQFEMQVFGIRWTIFVGGRIDPLIHRMCSLRSSERFVYLSNSPFDLATKGLGHMMETAYVADNLRDR